MSQAIWATYPLGGTKLTDCTVEQVITENSGSSKNNTFLNLWSAPKGGSWKHPPPGYLKNFFFAGGGGGRGAPRGTVRVVGS